MKKTYSEFESAIEEFFEAARNVRIARENFNNAEPAFFEIANEELTIAEKKFDVCGKRIKMLENI